MMDRRAFVAGTLSIFAAPLGAVTQPPSNDWTAYIPRWPLWA